MMPVHRGWLLGAVLALTGVAHGAGDPEKGKLIVTAGDGSGAPCVACHGLDGAGNDLAGFPRLAGMDAGYLVKQVRDYRSGARKSAVMSPNVDDLNDDQIADVAAYYATLNTAPASLPSGSPGALALGEALTTKGDWDHYIVPCETCHGPGNVGVGSDFPKLAGQHPTYIKQQLKAWKTGTRNNDPNHLMLAIAKRLTETQIEAVAAWLARQDPKGGK